MGRIKVLLPRLLLLPLLLFNQLTSALQSQVDGNIQARILNRDNIGGLQIPQIIDEFDNLQKNSNSFLTKGEIFGFAGICDHIAPYDMFCKTKLNRCLELKVGFALSSPYDDYMPSSCPFISQSECIGFEGECIEDEACCECAFSDCPLEDEGCDLIIKMCSESGGPDGEAFDHREAIEKASGIHRTNGRRGIRINNSPIRISGIGDVDKLFGQRKNIEEDDSVRGIAGIRAAAGTFSA